MTQNYIEIIKRSPYYYQVDGEILEKSYPGVGMWDTWKHNLPDYCEKERVFLDIVRLEFENGYTFVGAMRRMIERFGKDFMEMIEKEQATLEEIYKERSSSLILPVWENWKIMKRNLVRCDKICETLPQFFLRISFTYHKNDWTATVACFQNLLQGKIVLGIELYTKHTCFVKGTPVWTTGGTKPVECVEKGDLVATHNGRFCRVLNKLINKLGERKLYKVYTKYGEVAIATDDHQFLVYNKQHDKIAWKTTEELEGNDYLLKSTIVGLHSYHLFDLLKEYPVLNIFVHKHPRIVGLTISRIMGNNGVVDIQHHEIRDCVSNLEKHEAKMYEDIIILLTDIKIRMIIWKWVLETNHYLLVKGWWEAFKTQTYFSTKEEAEMVAMVLNLYKHEVVIRKGWVVNGWFLLRKKNYGCMVRSKPRLVIGDKVFIKFSSRKRWFDIPEYVYTLNVERDHSYSVNGYVVKNCMGLTPDTMVLAEDKIVPIYELKSGDYIIDKSLKKKKILNVVKNNYEGVIVSICNGGSYTAMTPLYTKNGSNCIDECVAVDITDPTHIYQPDIMSSCYYNASIDQMFSASVMNFLLRYLCDWEIEEKNGWCEWKISLSENMYVEPIVQTFHSFQYKIRGNTIFVQKDILMRFIEKCLDDLLYVSPIKLRYFFSYIDRKSIIYPDKKKIQYLDVIRALMGCKDIITIEQHNYIGDVYDMEIEGEGYCTPYAVVKKHFKTCIRERDREGVSYVCIPDQFFQKINLSTESEWEKGKQTSDVWFEIMRSQIQYGKPSVLCIDRNNNECVSGDMRILTYNGVIPISSKKDEFVSVWNGEHFTDVMITQTGSDKKFLKIHFSNGLCLSCTPYHQFYIKENDTMEIKKISASEIICGDEIAPFQLPSVSSVDILPSSIIMTLEWVAKRCVYVENDVVLFERDIESVKDILLDLQYCGVNSHIVFNSYRNEYELRIDKARWNLLNHRHLNKNVSYIEGDIVEKVKVVKIEETHKYQESYCFHEPYMGTSIFEGIATGQCENLVDMMCVQGLLDISKFLKPNPLKKQLQKYGVVIYTNRNCPFSQIVQMEYKDVEIRDIEIYQDEWKIKRHNHALSSVPAIFLGNTYAGNFVDFWKQYLCPVFDTEELRRSVGTLCRGLDHAVDQEKNIVNKLCFLSYRPILLKVRGFREILVRMRLSIDEPETEYLNKIIFETIHHTSLRASNELANEKGPCINSDKVISIFERFLKNHEKLYQDIKEKGLRNMISVMTCHEEDKNLVSRFYNWLKKDVVMAYGHESSGKDVMDSIYQSRSLFGIDVPNSLKNIYQNEYEISQWQRLKIIMKRKQYNVVDDTFHLYLWDGITEDELSELQQQIWSGGFRTIEIHKNCIVSN